MTRKGTSRRDFLKSAGIASVAVGLHTATGAVAKLQRIAGGKPRNVIFILSDDHRYDFM
ncbi:MAG: twin-arginine translocation signal domain-containing protein, partial [Phycisphaerales bacterium]